MPRIDIDEVEERAILEDCGVDVEGDFIKQDCPVDICKKCYERNKFTSAVEHPEYNEFDDWEDRCAICGNYLTDWIDG